PMHITLGGMVSYLHSAGMTLVSFAVLISVIVFFHELGHLLVGKWLGVKALRFSIGFGPKLFGVQWGETEYRVSLLPLGGYVKFAGDNPLEQLPPEDQGRGFLEQPPRKKAAIAFAGPAANFLLALILYFAVNAAPHRDLAARVGYVKPGSAAPRIAEIAVAAPDTAAARAGLKTFDLVVKIAGQPVPNYEELERRLPSLRGPVPVEVLRRREVPSPGGTLWVQDPVHLTLDAAGTASGIECADLNLFAVQPGSAADAAIFSGETERISVRYPIGEALSRSFAETAGSIRGLALGIAKIVSGRISSEAIGGPIMIADVARKAADAGWQMFVYVMAMISVNLGLMNLIPLPVLDGFHVLSAGIESVRRRPLSLRFREIANVVGSALVLGL